MKVKYPVFIQALALTIVVFVIGMYIGIVFEEARLSEVNDYYIESDVSLTDIVALNDMIENIDTSCDVLENANFNFVDKVYQEARVLEEYEKTGRITNNLKEFHKKYDILRTYLWINLIKTREKCDVNFHNLVYLYNYEEDDLTKKAEQNIWSKLLLEVKEDRADVLLIPIAVDSNLITLDSMLDRYNISSYPVVIVDDEFVFRDLVDKDEVLSALN